MIFWEKIMFFSTKELTFVILFSIFVKKTFRQTIIMANKRELKKIINYICNDLFSECIAASLYNGNKKLDEVNAILTSILIVQREYVCRISHPEPGMPAKVYFKDLKDKFNKCIIEITDNIANI